MTDPKPDWRRRALLAGGGLAVVGWVLGAPHLSSLRAPDLVFEDLPGLQPFRRLVGTGSATTGNVAFVGLEAPEPVSDDEAELIATVRSDPCAAFYGPPRPGPVPVAMFSDFACPICRVMETRLQELKAASPDSFRIVRHQLPILGRASRTASRAVLVADRQGAYPAMHTRLLRSPAATDQTYVTTLAEDIGLDVDRFSADLTSDTIDRELRITQAIADVFGFYGTPAFAVGRTVFLGSVSGSTLKTLLEEEADTVCQRG